MSIKKLVYFLSTIIFGSALLLGQQEFNQYAFLADAKGEEMLNRSTIHHSLSSSESTCVELLRCIFIIENQLKGLTGVIGDFDSGIVQEIIRIISGQLAQNNKALCSKVDSIAENLTDHEILVCSIVDQLNSSSTVFTKQLQEALAIFSNAQKKHHNAVDVLIEKAKKDNQQQFQDSCACILGAQEAIVLGIVQASNFLAGVLENGFKLTNDELVLLKDKLANGILHQTGEQLTVGKQGSIDVFNGLLAQIAQNLSHTAVVPSAIAKVGDVVSCVMHKEFDDLIKAVIANEQALCFQIDALRKSIVQQDAALLGSMVNVQNDMESGAAQLKTKLLGITALLINAIKNMQDHIGESINRVGTSINTHLSRVEINLLEVMSAQFCQLARIVEGELVPLIDQLHCLKKVAINETVDQIEILCRRSVGQIAIIQDKLCRLDRSFSLSGREISNLLRKIETQLMSQIGLKISGLEKNQVLLKNLLVGKSSDFQTQITSQMCSKIVGAETDLTIQNNSVRSKVSSLDVGVCNKISTELVDLNSMLSSYNAQLSGKVLTLGVNVGGALSSGIAGAFGTVSKHNSDLCQKINNLRWQESGVLSQQFSNILVDLAERKSSMCQKNAALETLIIAGIDSVCEKFSRVESDVSLALLNLDEALLEKIAEVDKGFNTIALNLSTLGGLISTMQVGIWATNPVLGALGFVALESLTLFALIETANIGDAQSLFSDGVLIAFFTALGLAGLFGI